MEDIMQQDRPHFSARKPRRCPVCGSAWVLKIVYGMPGPELAAAAQRGEVALGGCCISDYDPSWCCADCDTVIFQAALEGVLLDATFTGTPTGS
jgi:hypothetical protein